MNTSHIKNGAQLIVVGASRNKGLLITVTDPCNYAQQQFFRCMLPDGSPIRLKGTSLAPPTVKTLSKQPMFNINDYAASGIICADGKQLYNTKNGINAISIPKSRPKRAL